MWSNCPWLICLQCTQYNSIILKIFVTLFSYSIKGSHVLSPLCAKYEHDKKQFLHYLKAKKLHALGLSKTKSTTRHPLVFILDGPMPSWSFTPVHVTHPFNMSPPTFSKRWETVQEHWLNNLTTMSFVVYRYLRVHVYKNGWPTFWTLKFPYHSHILASILNGLNEFGFVTQLLKCGNSCGV